MDIASLDLGSLTLESEKEPRVHEKREADGETLGS